MVFEDFFLKKGIDLAPTYFLRSTVIKFKAFGDAQTFDQSIKMTFNVDYMGSDSQVKNAYFRKDLYCLGVLKNNKWSCFVNHIPNNTSD